MFENMKGVDFAATAILNALLIQSASRTLKCMKEQKPIPEIAEIVRHWMPDACESELKAATVNLRKYLAVVYRIFLELESEGRLPDVRDNSMNDDKVDIPNTNTK